MATGAIRTLTRRRSIAAAVGAIIVFGGLALLPTQPHWLGDPRGFSFRNPIIDLCIYWLVCVCAFVPLLALIARQAGSARWWIGFGGVAYLAVFPLLVLNRKNTASTFTPLNGTPEANFQSVEIVSVWLFLGFGGMSLLAGFLAALSSLGAQTSDQSDSRLTRVENQRVLGNADFPDDEAIHSALNGQSGGRVPVMFDD